MAESKTTHATTDRRARADRESLRRIFTLPDESSTLTKIDRQISENLFGFLRDHIVAVERPPHRLEQDFLSSDIPEHPIFVAEQTDFLLTKVVAQSVHTSSPSFVGHMTSAIPYFMLPLSKMMVALNQNLAKIETSKAFTPLERQVLGMLHRLVYRGSEEFYGRHLQRANTALGVFCSGGTVANITALWVARNRLLAARDGFAGIREEGLTAALQHYGYRGCAILVSERGHYSLTKTADLLGMGRRNVIKVDVDSEHRIDLVDLKRKLGSLKSEKILPCAIVGIAGTTETGSVDPLAALADIAEEYQVPFHVDAAWGGPTLFSDQHRALLTGIDRADSVTLDAHKQLYVPVGAGMVVFRNPESSKAIETHAEYVIRRGSRDIGQHTLEGSRPGMAMLVHSGLRIMGRRGYELLIDLGLEKAKRFAEMVDQHPHFELVTSPKLNLLTYRFAPQSVQRSWSDLSREQKVATNDWLSKLTAEVQKKQRAAGRTFVSRTRLRSHRHGGQVLTVFRAVLANPLTTESILADMLEEQAAYGLELLRSKAGEAANARAGDVTYQPGGNA